jgi:hypothetical protein
VLLSALSLALPFVQAAVGAQGARLEAELGFDGYTVPDRWMPLRVTCTGAPASAELVVARQSEKGEDMSYESFPCRDGLALECPVMVDRELGSVAVRLRSRGQTLAELRMSARARSFPGTLVLASGLDSRTSLAISSALMPAEPILVPSIEAAALPANGLDYDGVVALALVDPGKLLSPAQGQALLSWLSGGGRLVLLAPRRGQGSLLDALPRLGGPLATRAEGAGRSEYSLGMGRIVVLESGAYAAAGLSSSALWREMLELRPYEDSERLSPSAAGRDSESDGSLDEATKEARSLLFAALAAWLVAMIATILLARNRALPVALAALVALAVLVATSPTIDRALRRGSVIQATALVLPGRGSALVNFDARAASFAGPMAWAASRIGQAVPIEYAAQESGELDLSGDRPAEWRHGLARATYCIRASKGGSLSLEASLGTEASARLDIPQSPILRSGRLPPDLESGRPLAYIAEGESSAWWLRYPGEAWKRGEAIPPWLASRSRWINALRESAKGSALLFGLGKASGLGLRAAGGPARELLWVLPLAGEGGN